MEPGALFVVDAGYGGEGISEKYARSFAAGFPASHSSYGASDLAVNMAIETELSIRLRQAILVDERLRDFLIRGDYGVTPMIFQYNPLAYCLETNDKGELLATMSPAYHIAPKVRYNIRDRGHVLRFQKLVSQLETCGRLDLLEGLGGDD